MQCLITVIVVVILLVSVASQWHDDVCDHIDTVNGNHENCSSRGLDSIPMYFPNNTYKLELENNSISVIENNTFNDLTSLSWRDNSTAVNNLLNLEFLSLRGNKIASIKSDTFNNLPKLSRLWLQYNGISKIEDNAFNNLPNLQELRLEHNGISAIENNTFSNLSNLTNLTMNNNAISFVSEKAFENLPKLESLKFDMNCGGCGNIPFWNWLKRNQRFTRSITCNDFDGQYLSNLQPNNVTGCFENPSNSANDGNGLVWCSLHGDWKSLVYTFCMISLQYMMSNI